MRSKLPIIAMKWYKPVTFDLIRSGLGRTTFPFRGRLWTVQTIRPYRPSSGPFGTTFPQGKAILRTAGSDTRISDYTPSVATSVATAPPTQGSLTQSGQVPASNLGHSPSHGLRHDSPLSEGAKASAKVQSMAKKAMLL